jgi:cysteine synthase
MERTMTGIREKKMTKKDWEKIAKEVSKVGPRRSAEACRRKARRMGYYPPPKTS